MFLEIPSHGLVGGDIAVAFYVGYAVAIIVYIQSISPSDYRKRVTQILNTSLLTLLVTAFY